MKAKLTAKDRFAKLVKRYTPLDWKLVRVKYHQGDYMVKWSVGRGLYLDVRFPRGSDASRVQRDIGDFEAQVARC